jgi:predicted kinase
VIATIGLPGSGKSTWATDHVRKNDNFVRVNRDDFRFMLKNMPTCEPKVEDMITQMSNSAILTALKYKRNVIVDNTNLKKRYLEDLVHLVRFHADVNFMLFDVPAKKCIERDALRERKVGEGVILKMDKDLKVLKDTFDFSLRKKLRPQDMHHIRPLLFSETLPTAVIFDIDGTLALMGNRGPFDWFLVDRDDPNDVVMEHTRFHKAAGRTVILVSGRDEVCRSQTEFWLHFHSVKFDMLLMRKANDFRKDTLVKKEIYENHIAGKYNLLCVYDDRLQVLDTWYKLGVFTFNVNQGNHDF